MPTSTGRAAARLHVAQPPVSRMMRQLERDLGVDPFIRSTRTVQLTAAGVALTASAREILAAADRARASAIAAGRGAVTLPVSASTTVHGWVSG
ncbi:LysR family transcriptional regulator [Arthrobacter sp. NPDC056727]|uniref:LysR family transcriptional regulator n=1 Tax=Arthrobacter sp. NPDC056727 TaxID=3345927 RepID=UPI003671DD4B